MLTRVLVHVLLELDRERERDVRHHSVIIDVHIIINFVCEMYLLKVIAGIRDGVNHKLHNRQQDESISGSLHRIDGPTHRSLGLRNQMQALNGIR